MNKTMQLRIGDKVRVMFSLKELPTIGVIRQYQGKATVVKGVKHYHKGTSSLGYAYTLVGCKSAFGIDYEFTEDWLVPMVEGVDE